LQQLEMDEALAYEDKVAVQLPVLQEATGSLWLLVLGRGKIG
jgi:hypothetical protein